MVNLICDNNTYIRVIDASMKLIIGNIYYKMDLNKIFNSFQEENQIDFKQTPTFHIMMFIKKLNNHLYNKETIVALIKQKHPELKSNDIKKAGDYVGYNSAFQHLLHLDLNDDLIISYVNEHSTVEFLSSINHTMEFFSREDIEEYEKCSFLQKIKNIIEQNL